MSYRFLLTMAFISLLLSGVSGWIFFGEREKDPETLRILAYRSELIVAEKAAEAGDEASVTKYATKLLYAPEILKNDEKAWTLLHRLAKEGYVPAQVQIGVMYSDGIGVEQNNHRAVEWFRLATRLSNNAEANFHMGEAYFRGLGVPQDYGNAVPHYKQAAQGGHPIARYIVGTMYESGWGLKQDLIQAWVAFRLAEPFAEEVAAHEEGYSVEMAIKRVEGLMNHSQLNAARNQLSALQS